MNYSWKFHSNAHTVDVNALHLLATWCLEKVRLFLAHWIKALNRLRLNTSDLERRRLGLLARFAGFILDHRSFFGFDLALAFRPLLSLDLVIFRFTLTLRLVLTIRLDLGTALVLGFQACPHFRPSPHPWA